MSDPRGHDHLPDQAALDELSRAFTDEDAGPAPARSGPAGTDDEPDPTDEPTEGGETAIADGADDDDLDDLGGDRQDRGELVDPGDLGAGDDRHVRFELDDVDAEPEPEELLIIEQDPFEPIEPEPTPPSMIRIDDLAGSSEVVAPPATRPVPTVGHVSEPDGGSGGGEPLVISIDDGALPDAVYVEGSLDRGGGGSIVIIEDDDTGDTLGPDSERDVRRGIEPRMRERRVAVKRAQGRKRLRWVALVVAIVVVVVGGLAVLGSSLFAVKADQVTITGNVYADQAAVQAVIDDLVGTPVLRADTQRAERELEAIPWVDEARVRVEFPDAASIEIREREAWSTYRGPDLRFRVLDAEGRVLDLLDGYPIAYVLITGPDPVDLDAGEFAPRGYAAASELAKNLTGSVRTQVDFIEVTADGTRLSLHLKDGTEVRFGEARDVFAKLVRLETVLSAVGAREPGIIDVSTREVTVPGDGSGQDGG